MVEPKFNSAATFVCLENLKGERMCDLGLLRHHMNIFSLEGMILMSFTGSCFSRTLDISFNRVRKIENLEGLVNLKKIFLCANKICRIENLNHLKNLEHLELGDNKIRVGEVAFYVMVVLLLLYYSP